MPHRHGELMPPQLAIFLPSLDGGGAERVMLALAERFVARGIRCDLVIAISKGALLDQIPEGVRLIKLGKRKTVHAVFALARYLRCERPQVMLSSIFAANIAALAASMLAAQPCRVVLREAAKTEFDIGNGTAIRAWLNHLAASRLYPRADATIAVAESVGRGLIRARLVNQTQLHVIRNPISTPSTSQEAFADRRAALLVLTCGRLESQKDHATLLRAFAQIHSRTNATLAILGEGSLLQVLQSQAHELGISNAVTFAGFVHNTRDWMRRADLFVLSSRFEGMSNVLIEALACGLPIVATDCPGGTREVLADGRFGTLVPVGDDLAMAVAIENILARKVTFPDATEHLKQFDIERITDLYLDVLFPASSHASNHP